MKSQIRLTGMEFFAYHGFYEEERKKGGMYTVDVAFETIIDKAATEDDISGTINYEEIYALVAYEMKTPSRLIEHIAQRILTALVQAFPSALYFEITLHKLQPPIRGKVEEVSITLSNK